MSKTLLTLKLSQQPTSRRQLSVARSLNSKIEGMGPSPTLAINELSAKLVTQGRKIYRYGFGQSPFPVPKSITEELKKYAFKKDYEPVQGIAPLREAVANFHNTKYQLSITADNVMIGPGSKELMFILQYVHNGSLVLPSPAWVSYAAHARLVGKNVHWIHTRPENDYLLTPEELNDFCTKNKNENHMLLLNYPSNPAGTTYSAAQLEQLAKVARKNNILVLSDEIYGEVNLSGAHQSIAKSYPEGTVITSGLSKWAGAGGWRLGTMVVPKELDWIMKSACSVASETFSATASPIQHASITAYQPNNDVDAYLTASRQILSYLGKEMVRQLRTGGIKCSEPMGGFYFVVDFSNYAHQLRASKGIVNSEQLCTKILDEAGVALLPGTCFGRSPSELVARLAYVNFDGEKALDAIYNGTPLNSTFLQNHCADAMEGVQQMVKWAKSA